MRGTGCSLRAFARLSHATTSNNSVPVQLASGARRTSAIASRRPPARVPDGQRRAGLDWRRPLSPSLAHGVGGPSLDGEDTPVGGGRPYTLYNHFCWRARPFRPARCSTAALCHPRRRRCRRLVFHASLARHGTPPGGPNGSGACESMMSSLAQAFNRLWRLLVSLAGSLACQGSDGHSVRVCVTSIN